MSTLGVLKQMAHGIAESFGKECEVVIHAVRENLASENTIVHIENGDVTGRSDGDGPSPIVLEAMHSEDGKINDRYNYITRTKDGRLLKSSTFIIREEGEDTTYLMGINYDITAMMAAKSTIEAFIRVEDIQDKRGQGFIPANVNDLLDELIEQSVERVGKPVAWMNKDEKIQAIRFLNDSGAFLITRSADKVSNYFGISKYTLYSYINVNK